MKFQGLLLLLNFRGCSLMLPSRFNCSQRGNDDRTYQSCVAQSWQIAFQEEEGGLVRQTTKSQRTWFWSLFSLGILHDLLLTEAKTHWKQEWKLLWVWCAYNCAAKTRTGYHMYFDPYKFINLLIQPSCVPSTAFAGTSLNGSRKNSGVPYVSSSHIWKHQIAIFPMPYPYP